MELPFFILKTTIGHLEVSTVNLRNRDDWFETLIFDNRTDNTFSEANYCPSTSTMDEAWSAHKQGIEIAKFYANK